MILVYILLASVAGGFIQTTLGFGYGILVMAVFPLFIASIPQAAALSAAVSLVCAILLLIRMYKLAQIKKLLFPLLFYFLLMPICAKASLKIPTAELKLFLGMVMVGLAFFYILGFEKIKVPDNWIGGIIAGILCGILGGFFAVGGPPVVIYCLGIIEDKDSYLATMQAFFVIINIYGTIVRVVNGIIQLEMLPWILAGSMGLLLGIVLGKKVYRKIEMESLKIWIYGFIGLNGMWIIISYFI